MVRDKTEENAPIIITYYTLYSRNLSTIVYHVVFVSYAVFLFVQLAIQIKFPAGDQLIVSEL